MHAPTDFKRKPLEHHHVLHAVIINFLFLTSQPETISKNPRMCGTDKSDGEH